MQAINAILAVVQQINHVLEQLEPHEYRRQLPEFEGSTLGQHFRHILEFYTCLFDGALSARIDYSSRQRNHTLSENPQAALAALDYIADTVKQQDERQWLNVESDFSDEPIEFLRRPIYMSSMGRELQYAFDHAVHHLAIIRMGLEVYFPEIQVDEDLGVAPSTLKYKKKGTRTLAKSVMPETTYG